MSVSGMSSISSRPPRPSVRPLYTEAVDQRPPLSTMQKINAFNFVVLLCFGILMVNLTQFMMLPMAAIPHPVAKQTYQDGIRYTKASFGYLLILITQWCGPTQLVLTFEDEGPGKFSQREIDKMAVRDKKGNVISLNLPKRAVVISNHQIYADWWYAWCLFSFMNTSSDIYIVLKRSLKWVPIVGWGMHFFKFIFLARNWEQDRKRLARHLAKLGQEAKEDNLPFSFLFFPEGTVVSKLTRPKSKKFAEREGVPDMVHTLLPRSTGLHHVLRTLAPRIPNLDVIDLTVAYPGIPYRGIPQEFYTLRSIFGARIPPPTVHIHVRRFKVDGDIPVGDLPRPRSNSQSRRSSRYDKGKDRDKDRTPVEIPVPEKERRAFEEWLRTIWREKDELFEHYYVTGRFAVEGQKEVIIPVKLRGVKQYMDAFCFFAPVVVWRVVAKLRGA